MSYNILVELVSSTKINFLIESLLKTAKLALLSLWCKKKKSETTNLPKIQKTNKQTTTKKPNGNTKVKINNSYTKRTTFLSPISSLCFHYISALSEPRLQSQLQLYLLSLKLLLFLTSWEIIHLCFFYSSPTKELIVLSSFYSTSHLGG